MRSEYGNEERTKLELGELMRKTDHLATQRIFECEACGSRIVKKDEGEPCPDCGRCPNP